MPPRSHEPLRKVTLNLFDRDCVAMERRYGHGWSERVRLLVQKHVLERSQPSIDEIAEIYADELEDDHG